MDEYEKKLNKLLEKRPNRIVNDFNITEERNKCTFYVYDRYSEEEKKEEYNVISVSFWKRSAGYIYNLSTSILKFVELAKKYFPNFIVRYYIDFSIFKTIDKDLQNTELWSSILKQLLLHQNVELWFYNCEYASDKNFCNGCHIGTFGSLVRFHPFFDDRVDTVIIRNLELMTSEKDAELVNQWLDSKKSFHYFFIPMYLCEEYFSYYELCKHKIDGKTPVLATCGYKKRIDPEFDKYITLERYRNTIKEINEINNNYPYGVDEVALTLLVIDAIKETKNVYFTILYQIIEIYILIQTNNYYKRIENYYRDFFKDKLNFNYSFEKNINQNIQDFCKQYVVEDKIIESIDEKITNDLLNIVINGKDLYLQKCINDITDEMNMKIDFIKKTNINKINEEKNEETKKELQQKLEEKLEFYEEILKEKKLRCNTKNFSRGIYHFFESEIIKTIFNFIDELKEIFTDEQKLNSHIICYLNKHSTTFDIIFPAYDFKNKDFDEKKNKLLKKSTKFLFDIEDKVGGDKYKLKYLKYKQKYLQLKNKLI